MLVNFVKMHALGNDFVIIDSITQNLKLHTAHLKRIADRHLGIGCDQLLLVEPPKNPDSDFCYRIFNANGQEVEQCGNGIRCAAKFVYEIGLTEKKVLTADCIAGQIKITIGEDGAVSVNMGTVTIEPSPYDLVDHNTSYQVYAASIGNPHAIVFIEDLDSIDINRIGSTLNAHPAFPQGCNVSFVMYVDKNHLQARVYERHVGPTHACGSAACCIARTAQHIYQSAPTVTVSFVYGALTATTHTDGTMHLKGPATLVFSGIFRI